MVCTLGYFSFKVRLSPSMKYADPKALKSLIRTCKASASIAKIHSLLIVSGIINRGNFNTQLVASYSRTGNIEIARQVFDRMPERKVDAWNAIIIAYSRKCLPDEVINLYREMNVQGVRPDSSTFTVVLKACTSTMDLEMGEQVRRRSIDCGYESDVFVGSSLLNLYAKCDRIDESIDIFGKMAKRDIVSWTTMITGLAQSGRGNEAINVYRLMQMEGLEGDRIVMLGLIQACADIGNLNMGLSIHGYMIRRHLIVPMDVVVQTSLVDMYAKIGNLELASRIFRTMQYKNAVAWSTLISGYAQNGFSGNAFDLFIEMQKCGFKPNTASIVSTLLACSQIGSLRLGKLLHGYVLRFLDFNQVLGTALIDMYSKCGSISYACAVFDSIQFKDSITWNAMIASYGIHGHGREALSIFLQMTETNFSKPDHTTFASLLSALSHAGLVEEGRHWFSLMVSKFQIEPGEKHYACMIDLLARAGRVKEAFDLINSMKTDPGLAVWVSLLSGCHNHGEFLIGELAAKKVLEVRPDNTGIYALVSNFYARTKNWYEVAKVRNAMKKSGIKKVPGNSVVEMNGKFHAFVMEDKSHPQLQEIERILDNLEQEMTFSWDKPNTELAMLESDQFLLNYW